MTAPPASAPHRVIDRIRAKLSAEFHPESLEIVDESHLHAGHAHALANPGGESHFRVAITAAAFTGLSRVARQRRVYAALAQELAGPVHALSVTASAPGEAARDAT
jgi:BolA family transcriptional regulator, general stress-responsive regulator